MQILNKTQYTLLLRRNKNGEILLTSPKRRIIANLTELTSNPTSISSVAASLIREYNAAQPTQKRQQKIILEVGVLRILFRHPLRGKSVYRITKKIRANLAQRSFHPVFDVNVELTKFHAAEHLPLLDYANPPIKPAHIKPGSDDDGNFNRND